MHHSHPSSRRTSRAGLALVGVLAAGLAVVAPAGATDPAAPASDGAGADVVDDAGGVRIDPALGATTGPQRVLVRLAARSVALGGSAARVERQQDAFVDALPAVVEAEVLATVDTVLNGVFLSVDASDVPAIAADPRVESVSLVRDYELDLSDTVPYIGATAVHGTGQTGVGVEVAVLDSGIDYTHVAFGGPGTLEAYEAAAGSDPSSPLANTLDGLFPTPRVIGGFDFVGEGWPNIPEAADPDPIDRVVTGGHGTHVADIIGGADGVAPDVSLHAVKVCSAITSSCSGMAMIQGMEYAVDPNGDSDTSDHVDIVNMSLGSPYGQWFDDDISAAVDNATAVGVLTVASAGNSGDRPYITGTPGGAPTAVAVAQTSVPSLRYHNVRVASPVATYDGLLQSWSPFASSVSGALQYGNGAGVNNNGCSPFSAGSLTGKVVLVDRGVCNISTKAFNVEQAGGLATIIGLTAPGEPLSFSLGAGDVVNSPAFVVRQADATALKSVVGSTVSMAPNDVRVVDTSRVIVSTSSRGPTLSDGSIKPEIGAPGGSISALAGTGDGTRAFSGTSGAAPMVAGSAALILGAHPERSPVEVKAVLMNAAEPDVRTAAVGGTLLPITRIGNGEVRVDDALASRSAAWSGTSSALSFGFVEAHADDMTFTRTVTVRNYSASSITYSVSNSFRDPADEATGAVNLSFPATVTVPADGETTFDVTMTIDGSALPAWNGNTASTMDNPAFLTAAEFDGRISLTDGSERLLLAWQVLPRRSSNLTLDGQVLTNNGVGDAEVLPYALIGASPDDPNAVRGVEAPQPDVRYAGYVTYANDICPNPSNRVLEIALVTWDPMTHPGLPASVGLRLDLDRDDNDDIKLYSRYISISGNNSTAVTILEDIESGGLFIVGSVIHLTNSRTAVLSACINDFGVSVLEGEPSLVDVTPYALDNWFQGVDTDVLPKVTIDLAAPAHAASVDGTVGGYSGLSPGESKTFGVEKNPASASGDFGILLIDPNGGAPGKQAFALSAPGAVAAPTAVPGDRQVQLSWGPAAGVLDAPVSSHRVEMSTAGGPFETVVAGTAASAHTVSGLVNGTTYTFRVIAENFVGEGPPSPSSAAVTPRAVPSAPSGVTGTPGNKQVALAWRAPSSNGGSTVTGYRIEMSRGAGAFTTVVANTGSTSLGRTITGLTNGASYRFRVRAINAAGASAASSASASLVPRTKPSSPRAVTAVAATRSATVSWKAPASTGGARITGYRILVSRNGGKYVTAVSNTKSTKRVHTVTKLTTGANYRFKVAAINVAGVSKPSKPSNRVVAR
jgi:subtilisin family serine protease